MKQLHFHLGVLQEGLHQQTSGEDEQKWRLGFCIFSKLGHLWRKVMPALKSSVINSWRGLCDTAFCDSMRLNSPTQKGPFCSPLAKMLLPRHCLSAPAVGKESGATCWAGDADSSHAASLGDPLNPLLLTELSVLWRTPQDTQLMGEQAQLNGTTVCGLQPSGCALHTEQTLWNTPQPGADP